MYVKVKCTVVKRCRFQYVIRGKTPQCEKPPSGVICPLGTLLTIHVYIASDGLSQLCANVAWLKFASY